MTSITTITTLAIITNKTTNKQINEQALHYMECEVTAEGDEGGVTTMQLPFYKPHVP